MKWDSTILPTSAENTKTILAQVHRNKASQTLNRQLLINKIYAKNEKSMTFNEQKSRYKSLKFIFFDKINSSKKSLFIGFFGNYDIPWSDSPILWSVFKNATRIYVLSSQQKQNTTNNKQKDSTNDK